MPGPSTQRRDEMRHVEWLPLFADRDRPRAQIHNLLSNLNSPFPQPQRAILQFYGVSGQGKSALFRRTKEHAPARYPSIRFAFLDLEQMDPTRVTNPVEVLWQLTDALASAKVIAPLTVCLSINAPSRPRKSARP